MKRAHTLLPVSAILASAVLAGQVHAASVVYNTEGQITNTNIDASGTNNIVYDPTPLTFSGQWEIDFDTGEFAGNMFFGDYSAETTSTVFLIGTLVSTTSFFGVGQNIGGVGDWDEGSLTFSFHIPTGAANSGIASDSYRSADPTCTGSSTSCNAALAANPDWSGLTVSLVFDDSSLSSFSGSVIGVSRSGSGLTANTTTITHSIVGAEIPLPAAAWLFGTGLIGLAGVARRRHRS